MTDNSRADFHSSVGNDNFEAQARDCCERKCFSAFRKVDTSPMANSHVRVKLEIVETSF